MKALRLLGDEGRVRILRLLEREELSVAELQEILGMGQSRISMQLSQLKQAGLIELRRSGQHAGHVHRGSRDLHLHRASHDAGSLKADLLRT